ncbi:AI-2E family transporter [Trichlorobacter lovleyi]|uniref:AI-2E family transporter n=1 Tax=Trichlorobacter lovleyi TaxID=313985 RepID=UPI00223FCAE2|nr:AI-2E family transporter [Trichlorobacter lovleyi]QOX80159.1 AI-2E family transporter [Trichlorobacter lovleyi]
MDRTLLKTLLAFTLILLVVYLLGKIFLPFLVPIAWALIIGIITFPAYRRLLDLLKQREAWSAALMTLAVMLVFVLPVVSLVSVLAQEVAQAYQFVSSSVSSGGAEKLLQQWAGQPQWAPYVAKFKTLVGGSSFSLTDSVMANSKEGLAKLLGFLTSILANSFSFLMDMIFMLFILFFVYLDGERVLLWLHRMLPLEGSLQEKLSRVVRDVLSGFIFGTLLTCLVQGVLAGAAYLLFDVPSPLLLAVLTAIGGLIPVVGTALIWLPAALYLYLQGSVAKAVIMILWGFFAVGMSDNVVKPIFMSSRVSLPILPIMIGALGGLAAFGVLGAILGPLLLAILYELYVIEPAPVPAVDASYVAEQGE